MNATKTQPWTVTHRFGTPSRPERLTQLGRDLKAVYQDLVQEPLPERLAALVERLDQRNNRSGQD